MEENENKSVEYACCKLVAIVIMYHIKDGKTNKYSANCTMDLPIIQVTESQAKTVRKTAGKMKREREKDG